MALPKRRKSKGQTAQRKAHWLRTPAPAMVACSHCGVLTRPHHICDQCGYYDRRQVVKVKERPEKKK